MDVTLLKAGQHTQDQHIWIASIEGGQDLTHDTHITHKGNTCLRQAPAESTTGQTRTAQNSGNMPPHSTATARSAPPVSTTPTTTPPEQQTAARPRRWSGAQSSNAGTIT